MNRDNLDNKPQIGVGLRIALMVALIFTAGNSCWLIDQQPDEGGDLATILAGLSAPGQLPPSANTAALNVPIKVPDTGQTLCYNNSTTIACGDASFPNQDGDFVGVPYARNYQAGQVADGYPSDYFTIDGLAGIVWSCAAGQSGASCSGTATFNEWTNQQAFCSAKNTANAGNGFAGRTNWRMPSIGELNSRANYSASNPAALPGEFPGSTLNMIWSSTEYANHSTFAHVAEGIVGTNYQNGKGHAGGFVVCVSGPAQAAHVFTDNGDSTITDTSTNLLWQKCATGLSGSSCSTGSASSQSWSSALNTCKALTLAGKSWRLPNVNELRSILDYATTGPVIDATAFPGTPSSAFWSSTTTATNAANAWRVDFSGALTNYTQGQSKSSALAVRCVATAQ